MTTRIPLMIFFSPLILLTVAANRAEAQIRVTIAVQSSRYCAGDEEIGTLHLGVRMDFTNTTENVRIILFRAPSISRLSISPQRLANARPLTFSVTRVTEGPHTIHMKWPNDSFELLGPGQRYSTRGTLAIPVKRDRNTRFPGVEGGPHLLRVNVLTWSPTTTTPEHLSDRWRARGTLWSAELISEPVALIVDQQAKFENCDVP
jgi:hypothetical protein